MAWYRHDNLIRYVSNRSQIGHSVGAIWTVNSYDQTREKKKMHDTFANILESIYIAPTSVLTCHVTFPFLKVATLLKDTFRFIYSNSKPNFPHLNSCFKSNGIKSKPRFSVGSLNLRHQSWRLCSPPRGCPITGGVRWLFDFGVEHGWLSLVCASRKHSDKATRILLFRTQDSVEGWRWVSMRGF